MLAEILAFLSSAAWYSFLALLCLLCIAAILAALVWAAGRFIDRLYIRASQDVRRNLGEEIDGCMAYVRETDSPKVLMMALTRILESNGVLSGGELKAEMDSLKTKVCRGGV
jgi:hypothetical protein